MSEAVNIGVRDSEVIIRLTVPEAVVLDALLRRYSETDCLVIAGQAEQRALWNLQCVVEKFAGQRPAAHPRRVTQAQPRKE